MTLVDVSSTSRLVRTSLDSSRFGWTKLIVAFVYVLLSLVLIGLPFLMGYIFRVIQGAANGYEETPDISDWGIFTEGLRAIINLLPIFIILIGLLIAAESMPLISVVLSLLFLFIIPGIMTSYSIKRSYTSLHPNAWWTFVSSKTYIFGVLLFVPIGIFLFVLVRAIPIGAIILLPYAILAGASYWGFVYYRWDQNKDN